jgi:hypothetical protein
VGTTSTIRKPSRNTAARQADALAVTQAKGGATHMKASHIQLEAFNDCPGADAVKHYLDRHNLQPYISVVDLNHAQHSYYRNNGDTLVLAILNGQAETQVALALGEMAVWSSADEFTWNAVDGMYIVRLWWD